MMTVPLRQPVPPLLAVGAHLKNVVAMSQGNEVLLSENLGDLESPAARTAFQSAIRSLVQGCWEQPSAIVHDLHPNYASTLWAKTAAAGGGVEWTKSLAGLPLIGAQHHHAHLASALAENDVGKTALGVTWDGTGFGPAGPGDPATIWGGEFLAGDAAAYRRVAHLRSFPLLGGEAAVREPRRVAVALLWETWGDKAFEAVDLEPIANLSDAERRLFRQMLRRGLHAPRTTSAGRLFDGIAALLDLCQRMDTEAEAAVAVEKAADPDEAGAWPLLVEAGDVPWIVDWQPMVETLVTELRAGQSVAVLAARFHNTLVNIIVEIATRADEEIVVLTGGCFLNQRLRCHAEDKLRAAGLTVITQNRVSPGDGGISLGQIAIGAAALRGAVSLNRVSLNTAAS